MPEFITNAPWYLNQGAKSLKHQRAREEPKKDNIFKWYPRGVKYQTTYKYRKGACTNCGAMTHKKSDCMDRPRKSGAKFTGKDIRPDEAIQEMKLTFDQEQDNWNGYDSEMYMDVIKEHQALDIAREAKR